ncbi:fungal-specific transcription factor domain-containing protein [Xylariomycetidae sp. FL2044]|nr:fungal-specific transcription factor domain-containing protein [Xylariomycetidae sp. FL2044]
MNETMSTPMDASNTVSPEGTVGSTSPPASTPRDLQPSSNAPLSVHPKSNPRPFVPSGAITLDPNTTPSSALNPRSCVTCRRRKVRCDKYMPCGNCRKAQIQCVFPAPGRAPRRPRVKDPNAGPKQTSEREIELMKRLRKLEGIVEDLSGQIEFETTKQPGASADGSPETVADSLHEMQGQSANAYGENLPQGHPLNGPPRLSRVQTSDTNCSSALKSPGTDVHQDFGRLILNEKGKTRYVSNAFWSKVTDEIQELRAETQKLTDDESSESDYDSTPAGLLSDQSDHHSFVFGYSSSDVDLHQLHPLPSQIPFIWQVYSENVDPVIKILHLPTMNKTIRELRSSMADITPGLEALMFAIYFAAITSLDEDEVRTNFNTEKKALIDRYRFATEQALAKANFLTTSELVVVQAMVIFLVLVRRYDDTRFAWTLTGLVIRIGQSIGIHRDGTHFENLNPFDIEMRRRLWWAICILDLRSAEDQGTALTIADKTFDTRRPLNINDADIHPDMTAFPEERERPTDMTFCLVRYEICSLARRIHSETSGLGPCPLDGQRILQEREKMLVEMYAYIDKKYLRACGEKDGDILHWVAATIARLIMSKMSLIIYQPVAMHSAGHELSREVRDRLFRSSIEIVEYTKILNTEEKCRQWRWLFETYNQWHAVAYLLLEVFRRPWSAAVERAWITLNATFQNLDFSDVARPGVWAPLRKLLQKAHRHRETELARLRANPELAEELDLEEQTQIPPASFQHLPSSVRSVLAQEQWRKLVGVKAPKKIPQPPVPLDSSKGKSQVSPSASQQSEACEFAQSQYQYLDHVMAQPYFASSDILSVAFPGAAGNEAATHIGLGGPFHGGNPANGPKSAEQASNMHVDNYNTSLGATVPSTSSPTGGLPMESAFTDNNPPPWVWGNGWDNNMYNGNNTVNANVADGQDVNMDAEEDFNWQNWMSPGLAMGRAGFTGGI